MYQTPIHRLNSWLSFLFSGTLRVMIVNKKLFRQFYSNLRKIKLVIQMPLHRLNSFIGLTPFFPSQVWSGDRPFGLHPSTAAFYKHFLFYFCVKKVSTKNVSKKLVFKIKTVFVSNEKQCKSEQCWACIFWMYWWKRISFLPNWSYDSS